MANFRDQEGLLEEAPLWLRAALEARRVSPQFHERCREAAQVAHSLVVMRKKRDEIIQAPAPLGRYIGDLAASAGVKLLPVLHWLGIHNLDQPEPSNGRAYARLAKAVGMAKEDLRRHIVASLRISDQPLAFGFGRQSHNTNDSATSIDQMEELLSPQARQNLQLIDLEIEREYESGA